MKRSENINEIATALAKAQGEMDNASKEKTNPHFGSKYADLASVWDSVREPLSKNGLSIVQSPSTTADGLVRITTLLLHQSGQWFEDEFDLSPRDKTPQSFGSATTYGRRYALMGMVGIAPGDDDDGNAASIPDKKRAGTTSQAKPPAKAVAPVAQAPVTPMQQRNEELTKAVSPVNWPAGTVAQYCTLAYKKSKISELTESEYLDLISRLKNQTFSQAKSQLKPPAAPSIAPEPAPTHSPNFDQPAEPGSEG